MRDDICKLLFKISSCASAAQVVVIEQVAIGGPGGDVLPAPIGEARAVILGEASGFTVAELFADLGPHGGVGAIVYGVEDGARAPERHEDAEEK